MGGGRIDGGGSADHHSNSEEEQEEDQPLVVHTQPLVDIRPDIDTLQVEERGRIESFLRKGCGCTLASGFCSRGFTADHITCVRAQCSELTRDELDVALLGQLSAFMNTSDQTVHSTAHRHSPSSRQHTYMQFWHGGKRVCRNTFLFLHTISRKRLRNLQESLLTNGLTPRCHGNTRRLPPNAISHADTQRVINFLTTHAEANAILLPGRIPGYKRTDVQLLPSSTTKRPVWLLYCASLQSVSVEHQQVAYPTFCKFWRRIVPRIMVTKPMSDLCWICQRNSTAIMRAANHPEEEKSEVKIKRNTSDPLSKLKYAK